MRATRKRQEAEEALAAAKELEVGWVQAGTRLTHVLKQIRPVSIIIVRNVELTVSYSAFQMQRCATTSGRASPRVITSPPPSSPPLVRNIPPPPIPLRQPPPPPPPVLAADRGPGVALFRGLRRRRQRLFSVRTRRGSAAPLSPPEVVAPPPEIYVGRHRPTRRSSLRWNTGASHGATVEVLVVSTTAAVVVSHLLRDPEASSTAPSALPGRLRPRLGLAPGSLPPAGAATTEAATSATSAASAAALAAAALASLPALVFAPGLVPCTPRLPRPTLPAPTCSRR